MRSLSQWSRDEREKLKGYSLKEKLIYIWQYYRLWIVGLGFLLGFTVYALYIYITVPGEIYFYGILSNTYARLDKSSDFYEGFVRAAGYDLTQGEVELDCANYCKPSERVIGNTYYEKLISMLDGGVDDIWIAGPEDVAAIGATGRLMDLNSEQAGALRARYGDRFVYCTPLDESYSDQPVPIGIDLAGTALTGEYSAYPEGAALAVNASTQRPEQVLVFLDYLFAYEG